MYWGIDLGGTKIEGIVLDGAGKPLIRKRIPTEGANGYQHILEQLAGLVTQLESNVGARAEVIGMATPGSIDPRTQLLKNSNSTALNGQPFHADIERILGKRVIIANDANCLALAETRIGIVRELAPEANVVFGVIMGTGIGGGIVVNGKVINGLMGIAGEWGHNYLDLSGGKCYCGKVGCVETILSGPALERFYDAKRTKKLSEIYNAYKRGNDKSATETIERLIYFFGLGISAVVNILDPDIIVLGGGVGNITELTTLGVEAVQRHTFNTYFPTKIAQPKWGDSAGVFGAAFLSEAAA